VAFNHTITIALAINGQIADNSGRTLLAFIPPLFTYGIHLPADLYAVFCDAATWAQTAWDAVAGPGWGSEKGLMWEAIVCL
jgi:hypothetical protein